MSVLCYVCVMCSVWRVDGYGGVVWWCGGVVVPKLTLIHLHLFRFTFPAWSVGMCGVRVMCVCVYVCHVS